MVGAKRPGRHAGKTVGKRYVRTYKHSAPMLTSGHHAAELRRASSVASPGSRLPERGNARWHGTCRQRASADVQILTLSFTASSLRRPSGSHAHTASLIACIQLGRPGSTRLTRSSAHQPVLVQNSGTASSLNTASKRVARTGNSAKKRPKDASLCRSPGGSEWAGAAARREPSETRCVRAPSPAPELTPFKRIETCRPQYNSCIVGRSVSIRPPLLQISGTLRRIGNSGEGRDSLASHMRRSRRAVRISTCTCTVASSRAVRDTVTPCLRRPAGHPLTYVRSLSAAPDRPLTCILRVISPAADHRFRQITGTCVPILHPGTACDPTYRRHTVSVLLMYGMLPHVRFVS